jgi:hypothetical protein
VPRKVIIQPGMPARETEHYWWTMDVSRTLLELFDRLSTRAERPCQLSYNWKHCEAGKTCLNKALEGNTFAKCLKALFAPNKPFTEALPLCIEHAAILAFNTPLCVVQKQLFSTSSWLYRLGPKGLKKGDNVCVLFSSKAPPLL